MNTRKALLLTLLNGLGAMNFVHAETTSVPVQSLSSLVVTGTRTEKVLVDSPVHVDVIDRSAIEAQQAATVSDVLRNLSGVHLQEIHGREGQGVTMQGFTSDQVLVLIDGMPVSASTGSTVNVSDLSTTNIERIEVVRGATSALYGTDAMGGVVNIITRQPDSTALSVFWSGTSYGARNTEDAMLGILADQRVGWDGAFRLGSWVVSQQADVTLNTGSDRDLTTRTEDTYSGHGWSLQNALLRDGPSGLFRLHLNAQVADRFRPVTQNGAPFVYRDLSTQWALGSEWQTQQGKVGSRSQAQWETLDQHTQQDAINTSVLEQERTAQVSQLTLSQQWDSTIGDHWLTAGLDVRRQALQQEQQKTDLNSVQTSTQEVASVRQHMVAAYVQDDVFLGDTLEFLPGARLQWDEGYGWFLAPKVNLRWDPDLLQTPAFAGHVRLGAGYGYRVPNLKERYYFFDHSQFGYRVEGNPDLAPEQVVSWQVGATLNGAPWTLNVGAYLNQARALIVTARDDAASAAAGLDLYQYQNIDRATLAGVDVELAFHNATAGHHWALAYHGLYAHNDSTEQMLPGRTPHTLSAQAEIQGPASWRWHATLRYHSATWSDSDNTLKTPAWTSLDSTLTWQPRATLQLFLRANNLLDAVQPVSDDPDYRPLLGRRFTAGTRLNLF